MDGKVREDAHVAWCYASRAVGGRVLYGSGECGFRKSSVLEEVSGGVNS